MTQMDTNEDTNIAFLFVFICVICGLFFLPFRSRFAILPAAKYHNS
jgi:hypothetical protein